MQEAPEPEGGECPVCKAVHQGGAHLLQGGSSLSQWGSKHQDEIARLQGACTAL